MTKIRLRGSDPEDLETLWASPLGDNLFELDNSPFFAYGVSWRDVIRAKRDEDGMLEFDGCVRKSGNRTIRVFFRDFRIDHQNAGLILEPLKSFGCSYEGMDPRLASINIPAGIELRTVTDFLSKQNGIQWEYADPTYEEMLEMGRG